MITEDMLMIIVEALMIIIETLMIIAKALMIIGEAPGKDEDHWASHELRAPLSPLRISFDRDLF